MNLKRTGVKFLAVALVCAGYAAYVRLPRLGSTFDVALTDAPALLAKADIPPIVFGSAPLKFVFEAAEPGKVVWTIRQDGAEMMRFIGELTPVSAGSTKIRLSLTGPASGPNQKTGERLRRYPTIRNLYLTAMEEEISSTLEKRPFRYWLLALPTVAAVIPNMGVLSQPDEAAIVALVKDNERNGIAKAYAEEAAALAKGRKP